MAEQKAKVVHGPGPRGMGGPRPKVENPGKLLKRIMAEVFQHYRGNAEGKKYRSFV